MRDHDPDKQRPDVQLDTLLESLLSGYSASEPRPGLERRILANLRQAQQPKLRYWMQPWFLGAGAALVSLALLLFLLLQARPSPHRAPTQAHKPEMRPKRNDVSGQLSVRQHRAIARTERAGAGAVIAKVDDAAQGLPPSSRPAIFPTPVPLSEQEGFMFLYLANTPKEELVAQGRSEEAKKDDTFWDDDSRPSLGPQPSGAPQPTGHFR